MDWSKPYSGRAVCSVLDPRDGLPVGEVAFEECGVQWTSEGVGMTCTLTTSDPVLDYPVVRITYIALQGGDVESVDLFTGKLHCTGRKWGTSDPQYEAEGEGLLGLCAAKEVEVARRFPAKTPRAEAAASLLREVLPSWATVTVAGGSPRLSEAFVAEDGETHLSMAERLLAECNWRIRREPDGTFEVCPEGGTRARIDVHDNDVVMPDITDQRDMYEAVSVLRVIGANGGSVVVRDQSIIDAVGFERWETERDVTPSADQTLDGYAREALRGKNDLTREVSWTREFVPGVVCGDDIDADVVCRGVEGSFRSSTMDLTVKESITVDETVIENG